MTAVIAMLLMQYVVSVKAGLVNHVQGSANVAATQMVPAGEPVRTGAGGYAEILLTPGSFLRLDEKSEVVLDDVNLTKVALRLVEGTAIIEVVEIDPQYPVRVTTGPLTTLIAEAGLYRFADGVATVLEGKLETGDGKFEYEKGWDVFYKDNFRARKSTRPTLSSLDVYSRTRSEDVAQANMTLVAQPSVVATNTGSNRWVWSPVFGAYTFIPISNHKSPYGHRYRGVGRPYSPGSGSGGSTSSASNSSTTTTRPANESNNTSNSSSGAAVVERTVSTPSGESSTPAGYIESKSSPVGATR